MTRDASQFDTPEPHGFTPEQLRQLKSIVRQAVRDEFSDAGLRLDDGDHQDEARKDFMFVRSLRLAANGAASKVGWAVIAALLGALFWIVQLGVATWRHS